jgi:UDP-N-acetylglucosamine--N-acetylmuramyl-(pentapeptide) pyrophosphoryl-undecaprenol N-acetylglucosamine transferase
MKILLTGGGTAGHITPLLAVAAELLDIDPTLQLSFMGQKGDKNTKVVEESDLISQHFYIHAGKFRRFHSLSLRQNVTNFKVNLKNIADGFLIVAGFFESLILLARLRPDVIFFKGGFVVVPIGTAARLLRIPYLTHDSDPLPGLANRIIAGGAKKNAVVNEGVRSYPLKKTVVTGIPLASEYESRRGSSQSVYKKLLKLPTDAQVLFVYTGTQGSKIVDDALEQIIPQLLADNPKLHINYVFGRLNETSLTTRYTHLKREHSARLHKMTFVANAYDHIAAADVIVGRAGATSLAEFATIGRACIIIPAEQLTGGHQLMNAQIYDDHDAARIVREDTLPKELSVQIRTLLSEASLRQKLSDNIAALAPKNAARMLAEEVLGIARRHG